MKRSVAVFPSLMLLLPLLVTSCATKALTVPVERAAEYMIKNHVGIGAQQTEVGVTDARGPDVAEQLSAAMREALSAEGNKFNLVSLDDQSQIDEFLEKKGTSFDQIDEAAMEEFANLYGHEIPATAWITGRLIKLDVIDLEPAAGHLVETGGFDAFREKDAMVRNGRVEIHWEVGLLEVGSRTKPKVKVLKAEASDRQTAPLDQVPAEIDFPRMVTACVDDLSTQFTLLFTNSTQMESVHLFVGDGFMHMPWEDGEYVELKTGFQRMANKDYVYAAEEYRKLVERLQPVGGEMLARAYYNLGFCHEAQGDLELALENYEKAVALSANSIISEGRVRCERRMRDREAIQAEVDRRIES